MTGMDPEQEFIPSSQPQPHHPQQPRPFYALPPSKKSSCEIISEARAAVAMAQQQQMKGTVGHSLRPVDTKRPFTPKDAQRTLFGAAPSVRSYAHTRPSSTFSLRAHHFEDELPRPVSGVRLMPLEPSVEVGAKEGASQQMPLRSSSPSLLSLPPAHRFRLPSLSPSATSRLTRRHLRSSASLTNLPEEDEETVGGGGKEAKKVKQRLSPLRKAFSSPKERTTGVFIEREEEEEDEAEEEEEERPVSAASTCSSSSTVASVTLSSSSTVSLGVDIHLAPCILHNNQPSLHVENTWDILAVLAQQEDNDLKVMEVLERLRMELQEEGKVENNFKSSSSSRKAAALRTLYKLVERKNDSLLLLLANVILMMRVSGSNLAGVCKLVFKVARSDLNDYLFLKGNVLDLFLSAVGSASPMQDAEACVYGYGALKFLSMNSEVLEQLLGLGLLELMVLHLNLVVAQKEDTGTVPEQTHHALFQLTGAMRNVAGEEKTHEAFLSTGALPLLCRALRLFRTDLDLVCNISRTLSILSTQEHCCETLVEQDGLVSCLLEVLDKYRGRADVVVRLGYCLGNLTARSTKARRQFLQVEESLNFLLGLMKLYIERTGAPETVEEDVLVKLVRVIANVSMNTEGGRKASCNPECMRLMLRVLQTHTIETSEELVLSTLSTLNNLTYYYATGIEKSNDFATEAEEEPEENGELEGEDEQLSVCRQHTAMELCEIVVRSHPEATIEATRVLGNLSRDPNVRVILVDMGVLSHLLNILRLGSRPLVRAAVGVLVNIVADPGLSQVVRRQGGVALLLGLLADLSDPPPSRRDWTLACLICQVLWNQCAHSPDLAQTLGSAHVQHLYTLLELFLDEEHGFGLEEEGDEEYPLVPPFQMWEEFMTVATSLMEKVEDYLNLDEDLTSE